MMNQASLLEMIGWAALPGVAAGRTKQRASLGRFRWLLIHRVSEMGHDWAGSFSKAEFQ